MEIRFKVDFEPLGKRVEVKPGMTILDAARQAGVALTSDCGGAGSCGQCMVIARDQSHLSHPSLTEEGNLSASQLEEGYRLACQSEVLGDIKIDVPVKSVITNQRLQVEAESDARIVDPGSFDDLVVQTYTVKVPLPSLHDPRGDLQRVLDTLAEEYHRSGLTANPAAIRPLPQILRKHNWEVTVLVRKENVIGFLTPGTKPIGLAVDLGTTKIAAFLVDLTSGETLAAEGRPNPQIGYGEDVVSRMVYSMNHPDGSNILSHAVYSTLGELAKILTDRIGVPVSDIAEACIVGNTAMTHLLLELPVAQLALAPYVSATAAPVEMRAVDMGLPFAGDARVYVPPCVAGYVGADLVAMTLASGIGQSSKTVLGIDIGTNTEIILSTGLDVPMLSLSCASGPAFEGAHIRAGMRAAAGAIERVQLGGDKPQIQTIDHKPAVGICGSGIIDVISELVRIGALNSRGRFQEGMPRVRRDPTGLEYVLVDADETAMGEEIVITQKDVNEIQLAKGAILTGIKVLLEVAGIQTEDIDEVILAGAFGTYLNLDSSTAIGLLPNVPLDRYRQVGNAAGDGARQILVSNAARARANEIVRRIKYIELTIYPNFQRIYARSMTLAN